MTGVRPRDYATNAALSQRWLVAAEHRLATAPPIVPRLLCWFLQPVYPGYLSCFGRLIGVAAQAVFSCCTF